MIKKLQIALLFISTSVFAQTEPRPVCGTMEHMEYLKQQNPNLEAQMQEYNTQLNKWIAENGENTRNENAVITIPIVFHILYNTTAENISDAEIQSQLVAMNADFMGTNADASKTPSVFKSVAGNPQIQFCLAQRTPDGKATNGIIHKSTTKASFSTNDAAKFSSQGGDDAWDTKRYFNIWICDLGSSLLGYGEFPTGTATNTFGYVGHYKYTGTINSSSPYNLGRTTTHEIGHCLNLRHIWGDANCGNDGVADTPTQESENYKCPSFPHVTCSNGPNGDMFMNYMDYSDDACMNMFTKGQSTRMLAVINSAPYSSLKTSDGCQPLTPASVNITSSDADNTICEGTSVTFTAAPTGATSPTYQWKVAGTNAGTGVTYTTSTLKDGDVVTCEMTSGSATVTSNSIKMTVNPIPPTPTITQNGAVLTSSAPTGNEWYFNGSPISGATGQSYTTTKNGNYIVKATVKGCIAISNIVVINTGIGTVSNSTNLSVFPNPTDGLITVSFTVNDKTTHRVEVKNVLGQLVFKDELVDFNGTYSKSINLQQFGKGTYTITLMNDHNVLAKKIVVY
jgi:hypothetical protein